ncbi:TlpA family protein disulfide reductase [Micromonospora sp. DT46]|uniref:TlpA family protein disulfide reductase n=1 Tax=unclassified Micromonospora TaxID=2617518 RepID=UPI00124B68D3|nr:MULTISPECIES: TlpA disulfide reductase family protein [unclassified Micromonospora]KAB1152898.1 TlpA family protein disulfide reductase [Micromonospora sp. AMSO12t]WSG03791.1 TlpA family protein disulfide reductase [Micromonospora sp. NBC_01740]
MNARRLTAGLLAAVVTVALAGCSSRDREEACDNSGGIIECAPDQRSAAPKLAGELLTGGSHDVARDRGQVVVVNFWGSWCAPCRAEADDLENTYQATKASGVTFLGINIQDQRDKALAFEESFKVTYPSLFDPPSRLALALDIPPNTIPATVVLDRDGRIAVVIRAAVKQEGLQPIVERIAAEKPAPNGSR